MESTARVSKSVNTRPAAGSNRGQLIDPSPIAHRRIWSSDSSAPGEGPNLRYVYHKSAIGSWQHAGTRHAGEGAVQPSQARKNALTELPDCRPAMGISLGLGQRIVVNNVASVRLGC